MTMVNLQSLLRTIVHPILNSIGHTYQRRVLCSYDTAVISTNKNLILRYTVDCSQRIKYTKREITSMLIQDSTTAHVLYFTSTTEYDYRIAMIILRCLRDIHIVSNVHPSI